MRNEKFIRWCRTAAASIRYGPDREAVEAELLAHMEDKCDALRVSGIPEEELEEAVLRSMGSAEEIAPQLAAIHKPWLGYIYRAVKILTVLTCLLAVFLLGTFGINIVTTLIDTRNFDSLPANYGHLEHYSHPNVSDTSDGYRFQITEAGYRAGDQTLCMELLITYWPWMREPNVSRYIWATDNEGNFYPAQAESAYLDVPRISFGGSVYSTGMISRNIHILQFSSSAQWVELHYDRDGRDMVLRIDLQGGDGV